MDFKTPEDILNEGKRRFSNFAGMAPLVVAVACTPLYDSLLISS